ncbi:AEC family transporter [Sagittula salina]|uniref:AEC family transporter n=1 Tax=Sagittula salina TaxID=2820268 RepID=A0A940MJ28_9RHOB|nr:AEC family transporter [Sagittula salina]MBP0482695.1 AEC family transporter [Sagittula salina]
MLTTIWPLFALICAGFVMARRGFPSDAFWPAAERINYFVLFPALLVSSLAQAPVRDPEVLRLGAAAAVTVLAATLALVALRVLRPAPPARFGPALQGVVRFNTYLGFALVTRTLGAEGAGQAAVYLAVAVPLVNVLSILALTGRARPVQILKTVLRNPLVLACIAGIALAFAGVGLPFGSAELLTLLAQASLPLGLLSVGAALQLATLRQDLGAIAGISVLRLLAMPALAAGVALGFGLSPQAGFILMAFSAIPAAPTAYVLTRQLGGDGPFMAGIITAQTVAAVLTLPLVLGALSSVTP